MTESDFLAERFEVNRPHLRAVALRMLGSPNDADDAVQEAWLRFSGANTEGVGDLQRWLTTVIARICLDALRSRKSRREDTLDPHEEPIAHAVERSGPEQEALLADSIGAALIIVLDTLMPAERIAFVLHDMFDLSFDEIAPIIGRSATAARQLASRARRRVRGADAVVDADRGRRREVVAGFLAAAHAGDFTALLSVLDPDVVARADAAAVTMGAAAVTRGATAVANTFKGRAKAARLALINGQIGLLFAFGGRPRVAFEFTIDTDRITAIDLIAEPDRLRGLDVVVLMT